MSLPLDHPSLLRLETEDFGKVVLCAPPSRNPWSRDATNSDDPKATTSPGAHHLCAIHLITRTYFCVVTQRSLTTFANLTVDVIFLPKQEEIKVSPLTSFTTECNNNTTKLSCCVNGIGYRRVFNTDNTLTPVADPDPICYSANVTFDCNVKPEITVTCVVYNSQNDSVTSDVMTITYFKGGPKNCKAEDVLSEAPSGSIYSVACQTLNQTLLGTRNYTCRDGKWLLAVDGCYSVKIFQQLENVKDILKGPEVQQNLPSLLKNLTVTATEEKQNIQNSTKSLQMMVEILSTVSNVSVAVEQAVMQNFIKTVDVVVGTSSAWDRAGNESVTILNSVENFAKNLDFNGTIDFKNESISNIQLYGQILSKDDHYSKIFDVQNLTGNVFIDRGSFPDNSTTVITIAYGTMKDILPKTTNNANKTVNGLVMSTIIRGNSSMKDNSNVFKINMSFTESNTSLAKPECVWLNLMQNVWNSSGCEVLGENGTIICSCNHLTSFSILMGDPDIANPNPNPDLKKYSEIITYIGVGISLACLVTTLLIEALVWASVIKNKTSYVRHVCLVNIAVTLLVADIWFIIGASLEKAQGSAACKAAAFFIFFFYLSLFFWMLTTGLILFYRLIYILHDMSRKTMMIIAFLLGYGCPLLITVVTVASTEPSKRFTSEKFCWLDYKNSRSFLAFVVPALTIVFVNMLILVVVIFKLMRPTIGEKSGKEDRKTLVVIAKTIAILTPLLGSTWGLGLWVAIDPSNDVLNIIFSTLNSFQSSVGESSLVVWRRGNAGLISVLPRSTERRRSITVTRLYAERCVLEGRSFPARLRPT
ncbi:PREDICTED: adhesion G protein-coupled receptor F5-like [Nanorana parkeri]|uniref:adhesion G protein-coupled receptor F5-like n=1 Tax=Nanorana parkeri TaxID=125878 RepID=UPI000854AF82|nr:PREDICTED: adhesion G protein-coupled receptor F5-like [Nanorana parkeri]